MPSVADDVGIRLMNEDQARRSVRLSEEAGACQPPGILSRISASDGGRGGIRSTISAAAKAWLGGRIAGAGTGSGTGARIGGSGSPATRVWPERVEYSSPRARYWVTTVPEMIGSGAILATTIDIQCNEGRNFLALCR